jgi:hypothetical protein
MGCPPKSIAGLGKDNHPSAIKNHSVQYLFYLPKLLQMTLPTPMPYLHGMMFINMQVTFAGKVYINPAVLCKLIQHMIKKVQTV